jgi:arabinoxylan arabinofuranohydrolase
MKYKGEYYMIYHAMILQDKMGTDGGFRSLCVDTLQVDEENLKIELRSGTVAGVKQIENFNPYKLTLGTTMCTSADIWYEKIPEENTLASKSVADGAWIVIKDVDFEDGAKSFTTKVKGHGKIELRLDNVAKSPIASFVADSDEWQEITIDVPTDFTGVHFFYILFGNEDVCLKEWKFNK